VRYAGAVILWASPLPPMRTGVADYAVELLAELARRATVRVVRPPGWEPGESWPPDPSIELVPTDEEAAHGEVELLHLGNNPTHLWLLPRLRSGRPVVVLHDLVLHHLLVEAAAAGGDMSLLEAGLDAAHGAAGRALAGARRFGIRGRRDPFLFPAVRPFLDTAVGCVVHSRWAAASISREHPGLPVAHVGLSAEDPGTVDRDRVRSELGIAPGDVVLMHLGFLTPEKGLEQIVAGVAAARAAGLPAVLVLVGEGAMGDRLGLLSGRLGASSWIRATGWLDRQRFLRVPAAADVGVVLRTPSAGETSAAAVRFLAAGTPVAVSGLRQFLDWPEAAAPRLTPGPSAAAELARLLAATTGDGWDGRRAAARRCYLERHRPEVAAAALVDFLADVAPA